MRNVSLTIVAALGICHATSALAGNNCDRPSDYDEYKCLSGVDGSATEQLERYEQAAVALIKQDHDIKSTLTEFEAGQAAWAKYKKFECSAVFDHWISGTARVAETEQCDISVTRARTHEIWKDWLIVFGGGPPILPEPQGY